MRARVGWIESLLADEPASRELVVLDHGRVDVARLTDSAQPRPEAVCRQRAQNRVAVLIEDPENTVDRLKVTVLSGRSVGVRRREDILEERKVVVGRRAIELEGLDRRGRTGM